MTSKINFLLIFAGTNFAKMNVDFKVPLWFQSINSKGMQNEFCQLYSNDRIV